MASRARRALHGMSSLAFGALTVEVSRRYLYLALSSFDLLLSSWSAQYASAVSHIPKRMPGLLTVWRHNGVAWSTARLERGATSAAICIGLSALVRGALLIAAYLSLGPSTALHALFLGDLAAVTAVSLRARHGLLVRTEPAAVLTLLAVAAGIAGVQRLRPVRRPFSERYEGVSAGVVANGAAWCAGCLWAPWVFAAADSALGGVVAAWIPVGRGKGAVVELIVAVLIFFIVIKMEPFL